MNDNKPILSIVIPCFNQMKLTSCMLDSVIANKFKDWELLAVDDGSTEENFDILKAFEEKDKRIHVIKRMESPKGAPVCRNIGMRMARGKYIIFFDSDDYITPDCLGTRVECIEKNPDFDFMVFPLGGFRDNSIVKGIVRQSCGYHIYEDDKAMFASRRLPFLVANNIYRLSALKEHNIVWDTELRSLQDADFNVQTLLSGMIYTYSNVLPDYGYRLTDNPGSISKKMVSKEHYESTLYALEKFYKMFQGTFGHKYDFRLFLGALWIYNHVLSSRFDKDFANGILRVVNKYNRNHSVILSILIKTTLLLKNIIPEKPARQLPMLPYLLWRMSLIRKSERRMKKLYMNG